MTYQLPEPLYENSMQFLYTAGQMQAAYAAGREEALRQQSDAIDQIRHEGMHGSSGSSQTSVTSDQRV